MYINVTTCSTMHILCIYTIFIPSVHIISAKVKLEFVPEDHQSADNISDYLFVNDNSSLTVHCLGSGSLKWTSLTPGVNISLNSSKSPYQRTTGPLRQTLSFDAFSEKFNGFYVCNSDLDNASANVAVFNSERPILLNRGVYIKSYTTLCCCVLLAKLPFCLLA